MDPIEKVEDRNCYYTDNSSGIHCSYRKSDQKNIYKEIEQFNFPIEIVNIANKLYVSVVKDLNLRSPLRRAVVFACIFNAYKSIGDFKIPKELQKIFGISRSDMANGMKYFNLNIPKKFNISTIKISDYIPVIMKRFKVKDYHIVNAVSNFRICEIKKFIAKFKLSSRSSIGDMFLLLETAKKNVKCEDFSEISGLSKVTIDKFERQISDVILRSKDKTNFINKRSSRIKNFVPSYPDLRQGGVPPERAPYGQVYLTSA